MREHGKMKLYRIVCFFISASSLFAQSSAQGTIAGRLYDKRKELLQKEFTADAQIETGSSFIGVEFHHGNPCPQRISYFYPAANSADISTDYWKRDSTHIMKLRLKAGNFSEAIETKRFHTVLTPYSVVFSDSNNLRTIKISYRFCLSKPAMVVSCTIRNNSKAKQKFELTAAFAQLLRTSHTFAAMYPSAMRFYSKSGAVISEYNYTQTRRAYTYICNAATEAEYAFDSRQMYNHDGSSMELSGMVKSLFEKTPSAGFIYSRQLSYNEEMNIVLIAGTASKDEYEAHLTYLKKNYEREIKDYESSVLNYAFSDRVFKSNDEDFDDTDRWARAVLAANRHYLDSAVVPMPCPAEYNFYFTHDVLMTDLAVVNYDTGRVRNDLEFIASHCRKDSVIPHAYYWKESMYVTEYASADNWNHFWFIILSAKYLRHSGDTSFIQEIYPNLKKSSELMLINLKDSLIWAYRPDWWDIGWKWGPRAYMNILAVRALRDLSFIDLVLGKNTSTVSRKALLADEISSNVMSGLWSKQHGYIMNYFEDGSMDEHLYMGSLLAAHMGIIHGAELKTMLATAEDKLLDKTLGVCTVYPMDFHRLIAFWNFAGNEAGDPYFYINGGIWQHANAWYLLALKQNDERGKALRLMRNIMTIAHIMRSPNGYPAMPEYRNANKSDENQYGRIDKPQFMWAAGWYIYCLYELLAVSENSYNITFDPFILHTGRNIEFPIVWNGENIHCSVSGSGEVIGEITVNDGQLYPSAVLPRKLSGIRNISVKMGVPGNLLLRSIQGMLEEVSRTGDGVLRIRSKAPAGTNEKITLYSPYEIRRVSLNGREMSEGIERIKMKGYSITTVEFKYDDKECVLEISGT